MKNADIRYYITKFSIYIFVFCLLFLIQRFALLSLFNVKQFTINNKIYLYEIILAILTFFEVKYGIKISRPE